MGMNGQLHGTAALTPATYILLIIKDNEMHYFSSSF
jgi:hypothetical protein